MAHYRHMTLEQPVPARDLGTDGVGGRPALFFACYVVSGSLAGGYGIVLFTVQHNFEHSYASADEGWDRDLAALRGTSYLILPGWLNWITADSAYHHVHHLCAAVPTTASPPCHREHEQLFSSVQRVGLFEIPSALKHILWDVSARRLVSVAEAMQQTPSWPSCAEASRAPSRDTLAPPCHHRGMQSVFEAAGGLDGLRRLAHAWHVRVMADEVVSHAFSHGFHPEHTERLTPTGRKPSAARRSIPPNLATRPASCACTAATGRTRTWIAARSLLRRGPRRRRAGARRCPGAGAARLLRLGHHDDDVALPSVRRRRAGRAVHSTLVLGRTAGLSAILPATRHPNAAARPAAGSAA